MKRDALLRIAIFVFALATIGQAGINQPGLCARAFYRFTQVTEMPLEINWTKSNGVRKTEVGILRLRRGEPRPVAHALAKLLSPPLVSFSMVYSGIETAASLMSAAGAAGILSYLVYLRMLERGEIDLWRSQLIYSAEGTRDTAGLRRLLTALSGGRVATRRTNVWDSSRGEHEITVERRWIERGLDQIMGSPYWVVRVGGDKLVAKIERVILNVEEGRDGIEWTTEGVFRPLEEPELKLTLPLHQIESVGAPEIHEEVEIPHAQ